MTSPDPSRGSSPRFAYLVLSHQEPRRVDPLIGRLLQLSPEGRVVVHHDAASPTVPWAGRADGRVHHVERGPVRWGDWTMVSATLRLLRHASETLDADWVVLLSGEHRPVVDLARWEEEVAAAGVDAYLGDRPLSMRLRFGRRQEQDNELLARYAHRWRAVARPGSDRLHRVVGGLWKVSRATHPVAKLEFAHRRGAWLIGTPRPRRPMRGWRFHKGTQWVVLSRRAVDAVLDADPAVARWFQQTYIPDESYVHTVVRHHPELVASDRSMTFVPAAPDGRSGVWMRLGLDDLPAAWASGAAFARKVDPVDRPEVVAAIDAAVDTAVDTAADTAVEGPRPGPPRGRLRPAPAARDR